MNNKKKINIDSGIVSKKAAWTFGKNTYKNFDTHIKKSVPGYEEGHDIISSLSDFFIKDNSIIYDLGCSTGSLISKLSSAQTKKNIQFFGYDAEISMINYAKKINSRKKNVKFIKANINDISFKKADLIIAYYTLQFIPPRIRQNIINKIFKSLNWGGAFIFFEKVRGPDARFQDIFTHIYNDFKLKNGFSAEQIFNKSLSLKGVLEPFSEKGNTELLKRAGFIDVVTVQKSICFQGWLAIK